VFLIVGVRSKIQKIFADLPTNAGPPCSFYLSPICVVLMVPILISSPRVLVECSVFSRTIGRVLVNSAECHQHDYDVDRCTSIVEGHQVYYNVVSNESIIVPG
jgi:hypothetical protein